MSAAEAKDLGLVGEVLPADQVMARARELGGAVLLGAAVGIPMAVLTGRIERGIIKVGSDVEIIGIRDTSKCVVTGVEMFRKLLDEARAGDNVGLLLRGVDALARQLHVEGLAGGHHPREMVQAEPAQEGQHAQQVERVPERPDAPAACQQPQEEGDDQKQHPGHGRTIAELVVLKGSKVEVERIEQDGQCNGHQSHRQVSREIGGYVAGQAQGHHGQAGIALGRGGI